MVFLVLGGRCIYVFLCVCVFFVFFLSQFLLSESVNAGGRANVAVAESELEGEVRRGGRRREVFLLKGRTQATGAFYLISFLFSRVGTAAESK